MIVIQLDIIVLYFYKYMYVYNIAVLVLQEEDIKLNYSLTVQWPITTPFPYSCRCFWKKKSHIFPGAI